MNYVAIDVETTGLSPNRGDRIIEVGALALQGDAVADEFCTLVNAGRRISPHAQKINGISHAMLKDSPAPADVFPAHQRFIEGTIYERVLRAFNGIREQERMATS
jgi:DNA polymerase III epsilon subunit-like protein